MRHPSRGRELTKLEVALWRFRMVALENEIMLRGYRDVPDVARDIGENLLFSLMNHALILICKFLEVWDDFGSLARVDSRIVPARRAVQPLIDRIEVWPGIRAFRNTALAHAYLDRLGNPEGPWPLLCSHQAPTYHAEVLLLQHCVQVAITAVLACFEGEYREILPLLGPGDRPDPSPGPGIRLGTEIQPALRPLAADVDRRLSEIGVVVRGALAAELARALDPRR